MALAGDRPPRYGKKTALHRRAVGKPVPRQRPRARPCKSGSPDPDPFVIGRSQTTDGETNIVTMALAGDRPPRYGNIETGRSLLRTVGALSNAFCTLKKMNLTFLVKFGMLYG